MKLELVNGDITEMEVDAIVNAANSSLLGGGGVDGAIHRRGGSQILEECKAIRASQGKCATGNAVITSAGKLPATYVIHTVGPVWNGGGNEEALKLNNCYVNSLDLCVQNGIKSVAFPNISTGIYRFPKEQAATVAIEAIANYQDKDKIERLIFVCFDIENYEIYKNRLASLGDLM